MNDIATKFCQSCGTQIPATATFCSNCGSAVGVAPAAQAPAAAPQAPQMNFQPQAYGPAGKSKTTAVVLAVFFGFWSWLYTFKVNKNKFFAGIGAGVISTVFLIAYLVANSSRQVYYQACLNDFIYGSVSITECVQYMPDYTLLYVGVAISWGVWLWALIDNARKPAGFYQAYPNVK